MAPFIICRKANVTKLPFSNYINFQQFSNVSFSSSLTFVTSLHHLTHLTSAAHPPFSIGLIASHHNSRLRLTQHCSFQISFYKLKTKPNYLFMARKLFLPRHQLPCRVRYKKAWPACLGEIKHKQNFVKFLILKLFL